MVCLSYTVHAIPKPSRGSEAFVPPSSPEPSTPSLRIGDELHALMGPAPDGFPSLADAVYERLWKRIVNLDFAPGARLSEEVLARELGVSRTPVREALLRLGEVGLVRVSPRRGFAVPEVTADDLAELYDLRAALEGFAARAATPLLTDEEVASHRERQRQAHERAVAGSPMAAEQFFRADIALHEMLQRRAGNRRSARLVADVMGQLAVRSMRAAQSPEHRLLAIGEHNRILDALEARNAAAAAAAMEAHVEAVKARSLADLMPASPADIVGEDAR